MKKFAFTLAEVLITLGIIGIVAAMTLPALVGKYQEKAAVTAVKKTYSLLSQAFTSAAAERTTPENWSLESAQDLINIFSEQLKVIKKCTPGNTNCIGRRNYLNSELSFNLAGEYTMILSDGTQIAIHLDSAQCNNNRAFDKTAEDTISKKLSENCGWIAADINGNKRPNMFGKDTFMFYITRNGIIPRGLLQDEIPFKELCSKDNTSAAYNGMACTAWIIANENMDYLHCNNLSWDGNKKCK